MKLGLIGLTQSGKATVFAALTGSRGENADRTSPSGDPRLATVTVLDERIDFLTRLYQPKKTTRAKMEYLLPSAVPDGSPAKSEGGIWNQVRVCDGLLQVVRNFQVPGGPEPASEQDFWRLQEELILSDLMVVEKRIERIESDKKKGKKPEGEEEALIRSCREILERNEPLRDVPELASHSQLKGFTFLSAKPLLIIINNGDEDEESPHWDNHPEDMERLVVRAGLEMELASMTPEESEEFREAYHIRESALDRVIKSSYGLLNLISFFTVLSDEVRAWTLPKGATALDAAGTVHTDMKTGFIRAETLSFEDLRRYGTFQECKKAGAVRLEGKAYEVKDGDIINFRFNV
jgi:GTP-binding protein YchF